MFLKLKYDLKHNEHLKSDDKIQSILLLQYLLIT